MSSHPIPSHPNIPRRISNRQLVPWFSLKHAAHSAPRILIGCDTGTSLPWASQLLRHFYRSFPLDGRRLTLQGFLHLQLDKHSEMLLLLHVTGMPTPTRNSPIVRFRITAADDMLSADEQNSKHSSVACLDPAIATVLREFDGHSPVLSYHHPAMPLSGAPQNSLSP